MDILDIKKAIDLYLATLLNSYSHMIPLVSRQSRLEVRTISSVLVGVSVTSPCCREWAELQAVTPGAVTPMLAVPTQTLLEAGVPGLDRYVLNARC